MQNDFVNISKKFFICRIAPQVFVEIAGTVIKMQLFLGTIAQSSTKLKVVNNAK
jgi:hypothetical protein